MGNEVEKRVAKDGSKRGLSKRGKKHKHTILLENIKEAVERDTGIKDWDPVVQMAVVAARALSGYPATDPNGNPVLNEDGTQVMVPPDYTLATAAAAKVAPYVHQHLRPKDVEDASANDGAVDARQKAIEMARSLGLPTKQLEQSAEQEDGDEY